ncbi:hypothetical protein MKX03_013509, partial [Papaver bracteatum]
HPSPTVLIPAIRMVGNIVTGDDRQTQVGDIIDYGIYIFTPYILRLYPGCSVKPTRKRWMTPGSCQVLLQQFILY